MSRNVYVGNLPYRITPEEVRDVFSADGREVVGVNLIFDRETGQPRGFGFVEMATPEQAEATVQALDGYMLAGRPIKVNIARPREGGGGGGDRPRRPSYGAPQAVYRTGGPPRTDGAGPAGRAPGEDGGERRPWGDRPAAPAGERRPWGDRPAGGGAGGWENRGGGGGGERRPWGADRPPGGGRNFGGGGGRGAAMRRDEAKFEEERNRKQAEWERRKGKRPGRDEEDEGGGGDSEW